MVTVGYGFNTFRFGVLGVWIRVWLISDFIKFCDYVVGFTSFQFACLLSLTCIVG